MRLNKPCCLLITGIFQLALIVLAVTQANALDYNLITLVSYSDPRFNLTDNPTTVAIGPDGRLFVGHSNGRIYAFTFDRLGVTAVNTYNAIYNLGGGLGRLTTGMAFAPNGDLFVSHSYGGP